MAEKKQPTEAESLVKIGKKLDSIEFMFAMVIIAKVIFIAIDLLNSAG
jgi:hypothetical protein